MRYLFVIAMLGAALLLVGRAAHHSVVLPASASGTVLQNSLPSSKPSSSPEAEVLPQKWTTDQVIHAFKSAGLAAEQPHMMKPVDAGHILIPADESKQFSIPTARGAITPGNDGRVFRFSDPSVLSFMRAWYVNLGKPRRALHSYVYVRDNILVQINGDLDRAAAKKYQTALEKMR